MVFVLDTSVLIELHNRYYPEVFVSLWEEIEKLMKTEKAVSIKEVQSELSTKELKCIGIRLMGITITNFLEN